MAKIRLTPVSRAEKFNFQDPQKPHIFKKVKIFHCNITEKLQIIKNKLPEFL